MTNQSIPAPPRYIGKSGLIAASLWRQIPKLLDPLTPAEERRYLFTGPPGLAKTEIAEHLAAALVGDTQARVHDRLSPEVELINGQSASVDVVRRWQSSCIYRPMYAPVRVILIDEVDGMSREALNESRSFFDRLPRYTILLCTTNKPVRELQEQLQSRFKACYFETVPVPAIAHWLQSNFTIPQTKATEIASGSQGNVRAARLDALSWLDNQPVTA